MATSHPIERPMARHIVVAGPIAVGKRSLVKKLEHILRYGAYLDKPEHNCFLATPSYELGHNTLAVQLAFLFQRLQQLQQLQQTDIFSQHVVTNITLEKDDLFAKTVLSGEEYALYRQVYTAVAKHLPTPDLVIYLQSPPHDLMERMQRRKRPYEKHLQIDYVQAISEAYRQYFHYYDASPLLIVNTSQIDLEHDDDFIHTLVDRIRDGCVGRQYVNPSFFSESIA